eukprot:s146_g14.t1
MPRSFLLLVHCKNWQISASGTRKGFRNVSSKQPKQNGSENRTADGSSKRAMRNIRASLQRNSILEAVYLPHSQPSTAEVVQEVKHFPRMMPNLQHITSSSRTDGEAEGYRAPMRTNYMERLIESPQAADLTWAWAMLQGQGGDSAREPMVSAEPLTQRPSSPGWRTRIAVAVAVYFYFMQF